MDAHAGISAAALAHYYEAGGNDQVRHGHNDISNTRPWAPFRVESRGGTVATGSLHAMPRSPIDTQRCADRR